MTLIQETPRTVPERLVQGGTTALVAGAGTGMASMGISMLPGENSFGRGMGLALLSMPIAAGLGLDVAIRGASDDPADRMRQLGLTGFITGAASGAALGATSIGDDMLATTRQLPIAARIGAVALIGGAWGLASGVFASRAT